MTWANTMTAPVGISIDDLLEQAVRLDASDVHLVVGNPPTFRLQGILQACDAPPLDATELAAMIQAICPDEVIDSLDESRDADFSLQRSIAGHMRRFRVNVFRARRALGCSIRLIMDEIPTFEWAGFPRGIAVRIADFRNGLVLFTGITGSGKSTSMAMLIQMINERGGHRVVTVEEPIEYVFAPLPNSIISQREVGIDVSNFADGLKYGLRQDPDVILVGEIRDRETAQMALSAAETGHLVLSTMHTRDAKGAVTRLADMFPQDTQQNLRTQLAMSLRAVISQHLIPPACPPRGGSTERARRVLALEVMFNTLPVASAIRSGKIEAIGDAILSGTGDGMISLEACLKSLVQAGRITRDTARHFANDPRRI